MNPEDFAEGLSLASSQRMKQACLQGEQCSLFSMGNKEERSETLPCTPQGGVVTHCQLSMVSTLQLPWASRSFGVRRASMYILSPGWQSQGSFLHLPREELRTPNAELACPVFPSKLKVESGLEPRSPNSSL